MRKSSTVAGTNHVELTISTHVIKVYVIKNSAASTMVAVKYHNVYILTMMVATNYFLCEPQVIIKRKVLHYSQSMSARKRLVDVDVDTDDAPSVRTSAADQILTTAMLLQTPLVDHQGPSDRRSARYHRSSFRHRRPTTSLSRTPPRKRLKGLVDDDSKS